MRITKPSDKDRQFAQQQMEYMGKPGDGAILFPYGLHANVPADTLALGASVQGNPDNRVAIGFLLKSRPALTAGEVAFYHPLLPDMIIKLQANGQMLIKSGVKINIEAPVTEFTGIVKANGKVIDDTHGHVQGPDSAADTQVQIVGVT
jgi:hypothetical protein